MPGPAESGLVLMPLVWAAAAGYVLGSLPFGYLVARANGVNIFEVGSRSSGATNVRRMVGYVAGAQVLGLDAVKGAAAAAAALFIRVPAASAGESVLLGYVGLAFALVGHSFSCFTAFRGGKGVATAAGGLFVLMPAVAGISAGVWAAVYLATRYVSVASMAAALSLPVSVLFLPQPGGPIALTVSVFVAGFVVVRHRANIARLMSGTEGRAGRGKPAGGPGEPKP
jgi:acyl phosphate:glycerol-3-phosphate acyltransferase